MMGLKTARVLRCKPVAEKRRRSLTKVIGIAFAIQSFYPIMVFAEETSEPKSIRMTCGSCPEGYATTGVTSDAKICKDSDPTLVQCVPLGANILSACGSCPDGYRQVGSSSNPARCGNTDGGRMTQCQLEKMQSTLPDPNQGGVSCPPNCGSTVAPGQGAIPPPPKFRPSPEKKSE